MAVTTAGGSMEGMDGMNGELLITSTPVSLLLKWYISAEPQTFTVVRGGVFCKSLSMLKQTVP